MDIVSASPSLRVHLALWVKEIAMRIVPVQHLALG
jgi:hypothetical protein